jgi:hypothetical protein
MAALLTDGRVSGSVKGRRVDKLSYRVVLTRISEIASERTTTMADTTSGKPASATSEQTRSPNLERRFRPTHCQPSDCGLID